MNRSLTLLAITYEVTSQPSAHAGGFTAAHQSAPETASREHERLQGADAEAGDGAHQHEVPATDPVVDERRADGQAGGHADGRDDPVPRHERRSASHWAAPMTRRR